MTRESQLQYKELFYINLLNLTENKMMRKQDELLQRLQKCVGKLNTPKSNAIERGELSNLKPYQRQTQKNMYDRSETQSNFNIPNNFNVPPTELQRQPNSYLRSESKKKSFDFISNISHIGRSQNISRPTSITYKNRISVGQSNIQSEYRNGSLKKNGFEAEKLIRKPLNVPSSQSIQYFDYRTGSCNNALLEKNKENICIGGDNRKYRQPLKECERRTSNYLNLSQNKISVNRYHQNQAYKPLEEGSYTRLKQNRLYNQKENSWNKYSQIHQNTHNRSFNSSERYEYNTNSYNLQKEQKDKYKQLQHVQKRQTGGIASNFNMTKQTAQQIKDERQRRSRWLQQIDLKQIIDRNNGDRNQDTLAKLQKINELNERINSRIKNIIQSFQAK